MSKYCPDKFYCKDPSCGLFHITAQQKKNSINHPNTDFIHDLQDQAQACIKAGHVKDASILLDMANDIRIHNAIHVHRRCDRGHQGAVYYLNNVKADCQNNYYSGAFVNHFSNNNNSNNPDPMPCRNHFSGRGCYNRYSTYSHSRSHRK